MDSFYWDSLSRTERGLFYNRYRSMATYLLEASSTLTLDEIEAMNTMTSEMHLPDQLGLLGIGIEKEMKVLYALLKARDSIVDYAFQDTCISLYVCKQDLADWKRLIDEQEFPEASVTAIEIFTAVR
jgi:hypothetical protein